MIAVLRLSAVLLAGRRYWLLPLLPLLWLGVQAILLVAGAATGFERDAAQNTLIGMPVAVLAVFLGGRIITGELDQRSLEIAYTVPGGAHRVWLGKLVAAALLLLASLALMASVTFAFFTDFPVFQSLYGAAQGVTFYLAAAMGFATIFRSEVAGALTTTGLLGPERPDYRLWREPPPHLAVLESTLGGPGRRRPDARDERPEPDRHRPCDRRHRRPDIRPRRTAREDARRLSRLPPST